MSGLTALIALSAADAGAADTAERTAESPKTSLLHNWDLVACAGYGVAMTNGLSYSGVGMGGGVGYHLSSHLRLEVTALYAMGERVRASNASISYRSSYASGHTAFGVGYDVTFGPFVIRPSMRAGGLVVEGIVEVGTSRLSDVRVYPIVGGSLALVLKLGAIQLGVDNEAFFLPTWVAAPTGGVYAFAGVAF